MRRVFASLALAAGTAVVASTGAFAPATASTPAGPEGSSLYVVTLAGEPVASYGGDIPGYPATTPAQGQRFDNDRPAVRAYRGYLLQQQEQVLRTVGDPDRIYSYTTALDGFAATLTPTQVRELEAMPSVTSVEPNRILTVDQASHRSAGVAAASATATSRLHELWQQVGGPNRAGKGVVVGVIDTGIWPENPSFAGIPEDRSQLAAQLPGFTGRCQAGVRWPADTCNSKVVAARYFVRGFGAGNVARADYLSPRDGSGHGSHDAAVAAGNDGVDVRIEGQDLGLVSGVAPAARLSIYKACWSAPDPDGDGCSTADVVKAVDQAVRDGVDVVNYSVSGSTDGFSDAIDLAFLNAASAGVFVATSAGNDGPATGTVASPAPWVTTVGASVDRVYQGGVHLGDGRTFVGAMLADHNVGPAPLVAAADAASPGASQHQAALCYPGSLDATTVEGAIVVCERGVTARVSKSAAVSRAGGIGMVLVNTAAGTLDPDSHSVPTVHVGVSAGQAIGRYIAGSGGHATATLVAAATKHPELPTIARFSSRGPTVDGSVLKPDLVAPGANIVAAVAPPIDLGRRWDLQSGTSAAAPDVAGLAAVALAAHPSWSPATVKSALMTTAQPLATGEGPLAQGAGQVDPARYLDPGLVYEAHPADWAALAWGHTTGTNSGVSTSTDPSDLNQPSIAVGDLVGHRVVTRTVTNVAARTETYTAQVDGLPGVAVSVSPTTLTVRPGQSATFRIGFTATNDAHYERFVTGSLVWRGSHGHVAATPVVVRPQLLAAPQQVRSPLGRQSVVLHGKAGVTGTVGLATSGLVGALPLAVRLSPRDDFDPLHPTTSTGTTVQSFSVPAGTALVRVETQMSTRAGGFDVYVYRDGHVVTSSLAPDGAAMTLSRPRPGRYQVYLVGTGAGPVAGHLTCWVVPRADAGNLVLTPRPLHVTGGERFALRASWSHLDPRLRWFGYVDYLRSARTTYLSVG